MINKPEPSLYYDWFDIRKYFEETGGPINIRELPYMYEVNNGELFCVDEELFDDCQRQANPAAACCLR